MTFPIPERALTQHTAVLGKTGSGKTSTAKLVVEHVVAQGARVCVIDPIKSDWWGLTSSVDGRKPGLPFTILGGPHGHVPLHDGAGAAIAELVATGALPLSIIDMADFKPGGPNRFFTTFADTLMRRMKGVLYLVIEEAHEFAPKERSGVGDENMAIYYAKKLATAGRSKGLRMIVCTQAVQLLHNRVLGSCETMIVHRFTAPADRKPVEDWLKGNIPEKSKQALIAGSLPGLADGQAWVCSGGTLSPAPVQFPRIATFDNSSTPEHGDVAHQVVTARVDQQQLRALVGEAVKEAEENDPKVLRGRIAELERACTKGAVHAPAVASEDELNAAYAAGQDSGRAQRAADEWDAGFISGQDYAGQLVQSAMADVFERARARNPEAMAMRWADSGMSPLPVIATLHARRPIAPATAKALTEVARSAVEHIGKGAGDTSLPRAERSLLAAAVQCTGGASRARLALLSGYSISSSTFDHAMGGLRAKGYLNRGAPIEATPEGVKALGKFEKLPTGDKLAQYWLAKLPKAQRALFAVILEAHPKAISRDDLGKRAGYSPSSSTFDHAMGGLRTLELVTRGEIRAAAELFE